MNLPDLGLDTVVLSSGRLTAAAQGLDLEIGADHISYVKQGVARETFPLARPMIGWVTVSFYENFISVWCEGKFVHSFVIDQADVDAGGSLFTITGTFGTPIEVDMPEACIRTDNFILDAGKRGAMLLSDLIGNRRFFYQDDMDGNLRIFRGRKEVNTAETPYALEVENTAQESDASIVTRLRVEGAEVEEHYDYEMIRLLGQPVPCDEHQRDQLGLRRGLLQRAVPGRLRQQTDGRNGHRGARSQSGAERHDL